MPRAKAGPPAAPDPSAAAAFDFEQAMAELEALVQQLEHGEVPLEAALAAYERGVQLTRACQAALEKAAQKVELLAVRPDGTEVATPFAEPGGDEPA